MPGPDHAIAGPLLNLIPGLGPAGLACGLWYALGALDVAPYDF